MPSVEVYNVVTALMKLLGLCIVSGVLIHRRCARLISAFCEYFTALCKVHVARPG